MIIGQFLGLLGNGIGDIFAANCLKNGLLTIIVPETVAAALRKELAEADDPRLTVDLEGETITRPSGENLTFSSEPFLMHCLMNGLNEVDLSLEFRGEMDAFEAAHRARFAWLAPQAD